MQHLKKLPESQGFKAKKGHQRVLETVPGLFRWQGGVKIAELNGVGDSHVRQMAGIEYFPLIADFLKSFLYIPFHIKRALSSLTTYLAH